ncbi:MAG TPA: DUF1634 domain-containing protein [Candidatus Limnocylindrales bacterium]
MTHPTEGAGPDLEQQIGQVLSRGAWLSVILLAIGVAGMAIRGIEPLSSPPPPFDLANLGSAIAGLEPVGFLGLGLVAVIATPVLRVVLALFGYLRVGDRRMAAISLGILAILAASVVIGLVALAAR